MIREIHSEETGKLYECLEALAEHHNKVSAHFKRRYPKTPSKEKIKQFESELEEGKSRIAVIENDSSIVGFCKIGTDGNTGILEYLVVLDRERGKGYGKRIMLEGIEAAKERFGAKRIDIEAQEYARGFYEQVGFRQSSEPFILDGIPHIRMTWTSEE